MHACSHEKEHEPPENHDPVHRFPSVRIPLESARTVKLNPAPALVDSMTCRAKCRHDEMKTFQAVVDP
jgi:hypothetical protein